MNLQMRFLSVCPAFAAGLLVTLGQLGCAASRDSSSGDLLRYGSMHETVGQRQHDGRVELTQVVREPHFYGVGALEGLKGEVTVIDSTAVITTVTPEGGIRSLAPTGQKAALLVGKSVEAWSPVAMRENVPHAGFDDAVAAAARSHGLDTNRPFMFVIEGEFADVRLHVLNGACPVHARMRKLELRPEELPVELEDEALWGTVVGLYAADSVGKLTHPDTSTHAHLIYTDPKTGERVTGHLERVGIAAGAVLRLPTSAQPSAKPASP